MDFPIYRKYAHNKTFYKVESPTLMTEIVVLGNSYSIHTIQAKILPDRNFIADVIVNETNFLMDSTEEEFDAFLKYCKENLKQNNY